ncbi:MAG: hypothetical protein D3911_16335, partial [Candidatus Electrothrix sp. AW3_4]|nr:hypothetical protein [Candidatus Electrothrix gigas]
MFVSGSILFLLLLTLCLAGKQLAPHDPLAVDLMHRLAAPSTTYLLGTDQLGRCVLSRILCGAQNSLASALASRAYLKKYTEELFKT